ncbi:MAG: endolytic transglycosylase MltG [Nocardioides sp.]|nr:endolytic transglycosylase MltG [Nocardioides sp.]
MSNLGLDLDPQPSPGRHSEKHRERRRRPAGLIAVVVALAVIIGLGWFAVDRGRDALNGVFSSSAAEDYPGPGTGSVVVHVAEGDTSSAIARTLVEADVVASVEAFTEAAAANPESRSIQVGSYEMQEQMRAEDALAVLVDSGNIVRSSVTVPEGFRIEQIIARLAEKTEVNQRQLRRAVQGLDLPPSAEGNPEGYLFPATYDFPPGTTAPQMLQAMLDRFLSVAESLPLADASTVGLDEHDLVTVASIIEKEVNRPEDMPAVAEVIYNRLDGTCASSGVPRGLLQMDSTVNYLNAENESVFTSQEMRDAESAYNTYRNAGLPPGPIASPGEAALQAALEPTDEGWCYFVAIDLGTGETAFAVDDAEHNRNRSRLADYCRANPGTC